MATFFLQKLGLYSSYALRTQGPLHDDGWFDSFDKQQSVDREGNPLPWITYPAIEFLGRRIQPSMSVFEYGSGWGTLWWASRVKEVISVEHDKAWYERFRPQLPPNAALLHCELEYDGAYCQVITRFSQHFDIVVIDGRDRVNCALHCLPALKSDGVIVWDNSDRSKYSAGYEYLFHHGFRKIEFVGLGPIDALESETGIFYRSHNCLGI